MRKRRADSTLFSLPDPTQRAVYLLEEESRLTLSQIQQVLVTPEDQVAIPESSDADGAVQRDAMPGMDVGYVSLSSLSNFLKEWRTKAWRESLHAAAATAEAVDGEITDEDRARMDNSMIDGVREIVMDSFTSGKIDVDGLVKLLDRVLKAKSLEHDARKLALLEKKAEAFDALEKAVDTPGGLTPETLLQIREKAGLL